MSEVQTKQWRRKRVQATEKGFAEQRVKTSVSKIEFCQSSFTCH